MIGEGKTVGSWRLAVGGCQKEKRLVKVNTCGERKYDGEGKTAGERKYGWRMEILLAKGKTVGGWRMEILLAKEKRLVEGNTCGER